MLLLQVALSNKKEARETGIVLVSAFLFMLSLKIRRYKKNRLNQILHVVHCLLIFIKGFAPTENDFKCKTTVHIKIVLKITLAIYYGPPFRSKFNTKHKGSVTFSYLLEIIALLDIHLQRLNILQEKFHFMEFRNFNICLRLFSNVH